MSIALTPARSTLPTTNLQEMLDATDSAGGTARVGMAQYFTPPWFAHLMAGLCPGYVQAVIDLQAGRGDLLHSFPGSGVERFGVEIDRRLSEDAPTPASGSLTSGRRPRIITANCVRFHELWRELYPTFTFPYVVANPPFSLRFKTADGPTDSTLWTFRACLDLAGPHGTGYFIANAATLEKLDLHRHDQAWGYQRFPSGIFPDADVEIGVIHFHGAHTGGPLASGCFASSASEAAVTTAVTRFADLCEKANGTTIACHHPTYTSQGTAELVAAFQIIAEVIAEEKRPKSPFNIWLRHDGTLATYLSTHEKIKRGLTPKDIARLATLDKSHPLALTPEKETRELLRELIENGTYTLDPRARSAIADALEQAAVAAVPIMPVTDFQRVAYCDEEEELPALAGTTTVSVKVTRGRTDCAGRFFFHQATAAGVRILSQTNPEGHWYGYFFDVPTGQACGKPVYITSDSPRAAIDWVVEQAQRRTPALTAGHRYPLVTATYEYVDSYQRKKLHMDGGGTYAADHKLTLTGQDRFIEIRDDEGRRFRFMDRPSPAAQGHVELPDAMMWDFFVKPDVPTVAERFPEAVAHNLAVLDSIELMAGFAYYEGQRPYLARTATRDFALIGAETGTGKSLMCISLIVLKAPRRALIVAPQGTTRTAEDDEEGGEPEMSASQWITELRRFAPGMQVFELFALADYERIIAQNGGVLPHGIYVSYYEAMFSNSAREHLPKKSNITNQRLLGESGLYPADVGANALLSDLCDGIGDEHAGIRCIARPTLATRIGHLFDFVGLDEAHKAQKLSSQSTQQIIRLQPRYRYAFTATPIPNIVSDIFPLCGWLAVEGWYRGGRRNATWPYAREEGGRFCQTFLCTERDLTQEAMNRSADNEWKGKCEKISPTVSAPARLLKLLTPIMAYISKLDCNPHLPPRIVHDLRVPMAARQARLYAHYMNRTNIPGKNAVEKAGKQVAILRSLCAEPASSPWNNVYGKTIPSQFNPKTAAILGLCAKILGAGRQVVIVCARLGQNDYLERKLREAGVRIARIDSSRPADRHTEQANLFKSRRADVLLMGIKCAQAHSFPLCQDLIIGSLEYTFGSFEQAVGRVYRVTTPAAVNIWCVLHKNSIEEIMFDAVATKGDAATICLRGQRVPRDYRSADVGEILARNFEQITEGGAFAGLPDEATTEAEWPALRKQLQLACDSTCPALN